MATPAPATVIDPVERFERDRQVLRSGDHTEEQLPKAKTAVERPVAATNQR